MSAVKAKTLFADGFQILIVRVLNLVCAAGVSIFVSRMLGPEGRGTYVVPGMLAGLVATVFAGLTTTIASSMLKDRAGSGAIRAAFAAAVPMVATGIVVVMAITVATNQLWAAPYAAIVLPFMALIAIVNGYGYGVKNPRLVTLFTLATNIAIFICLAAGLLFVGRTANVAIESWFAGNVFVGLVAICVVLWSARGMATGPIATWAFLTYAARIGAIGLVSILNYRIDLYMVAFFTSHSQLGFYSTAVSAAETLLVAAQVGSIVTVPHIGSLGAREAAHLTARCVRNNFAFITVLCIVAALVAPAAVELLFGPAFLPAVAPLRVLLIGIIPMSAASIISSYYTLNAKKPQYPLIIAGASAFICAAISLILIPRIGIVGAAIGTTVSYISTVIASMIIFSIQAKVPLWHVACVQPEDLHGYRRLISSYLSKPLNSPVEENLASGLE
jgi:O-antigen/teichoic acid export membrane protein